MTSTRAFFACASFVMIGCGSSEPAATTPADAATDFGAPTVPAESCVRPGDKGNDKGVGTACTPLGKECAGFPGAPVCLADVGQKQWMCSRIGCTTDAECGTDATCFKDSKGSGCVPNRCLDKPGDAGVDAGSTDGGGGDAGGGDATASD